MKKTVMITQTALFSALICVMTAFIGHIPVGVNGGYIHFGDALIFLCAAMLPKPWSVAAAAIGGGLADLLTAPSWIIATVLIKSALTVAFKNTGRILCLRNIAAAVAAVVISTAGYFFAEWIMFGSLAASLAGIPANIVQSVGSAVIFFAIGFIFDRFDLKKHLK